MCAVVVRIDVPRVAQRLDAAREAALRAQARTPRRELPARLAAHAHRSVARGAVLINEAALHHAVLRERVRLRVPSRRIAVLRDEPCTAVARSAYDASVAVARRAL